MQVAAQRITSPAEDLRHVNELETLAAFASGPCLPGNLPSLIAAHQHFELTTWKPPGNRISDVPQLS